jgi:hypothetical protein
MAAKMPRLLAALLSILCLSSGFGLAAQEGRKVAVLFSSASLEEGPWRASIEGALATSIRVGLVLRVPEAADPIAFAYSRGCDLAISIEAESSDIGVKISWRIDAPAFASTNDGSPPPPVDAFEYEAPLPDQRRLATSFWLDLRARVEAALGKLPVAGSAFLILHGEAGLMVEGLSKAAQVIPEGGELTLRLRSPATYLWTAHAPGKELKRGVLSLAGPTTLEILLEARKRLSLDVGLNHGAFADFRLALFSKSDSLYARVALNPYFLGLSLRSADEYDPAPLLVSYNLLEPGLGGGILLGNELSKSRLSFGFDAFLRVRSMGNDGPLDSIAPFRLAFYTGIEWSLIRGTELFFELGLDYYPGCIGYLMTAMGDSGGFQWASHAGTDYYVEFPSFRFGLRWRP